MGQSTQPETKARLSKLGVMEEVMKQKEKPVNAVARKQRTKANKLSKNATNTG